MQRLVERMQRVQDWIAFVFISVMTICVSLQVFVRYVLQVPMFLWSEELTRFVLIWTVFLGIGVGVKNDAHFAMDVLPPFFGRRGEAVLRLFNHVSMGAILVLLILAGLRFSYFGLFEWSPNMEIPMVLVYASIPLGGGLALIYLVERIRRRLRDLGSEVQ